MATTSKTNIWIDGAQAGASLLTLKKAVYALNKEIKELPRNSDDYKKKMLELKDASSALNVHKSQIKGVSESYGQAKTSIGGMMKQFAPVAGVVGAIGLAVQGVSSAVGSWYTNNKEMEKSLSSLKSLTGASTEDIKFYKKEATELGKTTTLSAIQVVEAYKLIGSARPDLLKNKEALNQVAKETITLAEAAEMDLGGAATAMTGIMNQFNLGAESSSRIINTLAAGSKEGASDISDLSATIDKSGSVMKGYNVQVEEGVALAEMLGERNIKGAEAGTQLRNVLLTMQGIEALPQKALDQLDKYGVDVKKVADDTVPFQERLTEMSKVSGDATAMIEIFGKENIVAGKAILENVGKVESLTAAVTGTNTAYEQAAINTDNLDGDLKSLGSAWEGLTLSMDGGSNVFRPIVQAGTDMLNWVSDSIVAFKEWDTTKMETQLLKLANSIPLVNMAFGDMFEQQIRLNEITSSVVEQVRSEGDEMMILTESIKNNNSALSNKNITSEEAARIEEENAQIIGVLNERYPELAGNIDLTKVSAEEMNDIQKQLNATIVQQVIETAKAAEQQRILEQIISDTIKVQRLNRDEQARGAVGNFFADIFGESSTDVYKNIIKTSGELNNLEGDFKNVEKTVNSMDLQLGAEFDANGKMAANALKEMESLVKKLDKTTDESQKKILKSRIKGLEEAAKMGNKSQKEMLNGILTSVDEIDKKDDETKKKSEDRAKRLEEANKKAADSYRKLKEQLEKLQEASKKFAEDLDYTKKLDAFVEGQEKELFALQKSIDDKYAAEIANAEKLSKQKGKIGKKATEELNALLAVKEQELTHERLKINKKYAEELNAQELDEATKMMAQYLNQQESMEKALMDLKVMSATNAAAEAANADINTRKAANEELKAVLLEQLEFERKAKEKALKLELKNGVINKEEFDAQKAMLEIDHRQKIEGINKESNEKILQDQLDKYASMLEGVSSAIDTISKFYEAMYQNRLTQIGKEQKASESALDEQLRSGSLSQEEYEAEKLRIQEEADEKRKVIENQKAKKDKEVAIAQAIIATALAVVKAAPVVPLMVAAGLAGAAQVALIAATEVPQYADGGYTDVIGANDGKKYNAKNLGRLSGGMTPRNPSLALISEEGPEYFVPNHLLQNQQVLNSVRVIEAIRTNQYAEGGFTSPIAVGSGAMSDERVVAFLQANLSMLSALNSKIPNMQAVIDDGTVDAINKRTSELNTLRN